MFSSLMSCATARFPFHAPYFPSGRKRLKIDHAKPLDTSDGILRAYMQTVTVSFLMKDWKVTDCPVYTPSEYEIDESTRKESIT